MAVGTSTAPRQLGEYHLLEKIADGGMGSVFRGRRIDGGPFIAIKVLPAETARNPLLLKRFEQEFRAAAAIQHPNVVKAIDFGTQPTPYLVMELVEGSSLGQRVELGGPLSTADSIHVIGQVCDGLHAAHKQGLIHRDVKPDNVLVTADLLAKLTDLGLVRDLESDENLTRTGKGLGTPFYMAPEQFRNAKNVDVRSDVYSLGATLYTMVTGKIPFAKCSPLDCWMKKTKDDFPAPKLLVPSLPDRLDFTIRRAMRANPAERPTSCREFMEDLLGETWKLRSNGGGSAPQAPIAAADDIWYMVFYDCGLPKTVKGTTETIRKNIRANVLGDLSVILVSRTKAGPFSPLKSIAAFRDLILAEMLGESSGVAMEQAVFKPPLELDRSGIGPSIPAAVTVTSQTPVSKDLKSGTRSRIAPTPLPMDTPAPGRGLFDSTPPELPYALATGKTEEFPAVPLTNADNLEIGTDERPSLSTRDRIATLKTATPRKSSRTLNSKPIQYSTPSWVYLVGAVAVLTALGLGLALGLALK